MRAHRSAFETQAPPAGARAASQFTDVRRQRFSHVDQSIRVSIAAHAVQITQAKEKWGELSVNGMGGDDSTYGLIDIAEALSAHICELCGSPGRLHEGQIFRTRCSEHAPK